MGREVHTWCDNCAKRDVPMIPFQWFDSDDGISRKAELCEGCHRLLMRHVDQWMKPLDAVFPQDLGHEVGTTVTHAEPVALAHGTAEVATLPMTCPHCGVRRHGDAERTACERCGYTRARWLSDRNERERTTT